MQEKKAEEPKLSDRDNLKSKRIQSIEELGDASQEMTETLASLSLDSGARSTGDAQWSLALRVPEPAGRLGFIELCSLESREISAFSSSQRRVRTGVDPEAELERASPPATSAPHGAEVFCCQSGRYALVVIRKG